MISVTTYYWTAYQITVTMKNETISRIILVLEIAAIILFHSLKADGRRDETIAAEQNDSRQTIQQSTHIVSTGSSLATHP